jgi:hypothetical protein
LQVLEALECRRLLSAGAAAGHAGLLVVDDDGVTRAPHAIAVENPDRPDHPLRANPAAPGGLDASSIAGGQRLAQIRTDKPDGGDEQDDLEDLPLSGGAAAGGPDAKFIAAAIPPTFSTITLSGDTGEVADTARPLVIRAPRAAVEPLGQLIPAVLEVRRAREPMAPVIQGAATVSERHIRTFVAAGTAVRGAITGGARAALAGVSGVHASAQAVGIAMEQIRRALVASGAAAAGEFAPVAMPPSLAAGWPDAMVTFGDALASFTHESATVGTFFAVAARRHTRAWAVTFAVLAADAILLSRSWTSHRHRRQRLLGPGETIA